MDGEETKIETAANEAEPGPEKKAKPSVRGRKKKTVTTVTTGRIYIQATYNNTIITVADPHGNVIGWSSAGVVGFKGPKKSTPYAASVIVRDALEKAKGYNLKEAHVLVKGVGSGRESAVRAINANGIQVLSIKDSTPIPHNGCRAPRPRRV
jgi:small subunit ribosomal protein S11